MKILHAVESGSRAWGFASPDSDYDVRFIYRREPGEYLRLESVRDTIEWQLDEVLDINGWDIKKTLQQFHRGNATLFEWSNSPIVYKTTEEWHQIYEQVKCCFSKKAAINHYYGTANNTYLQYLTGEQIKYKKYFYALRPLLACRYIENFDRIPPVRFEQLLELSLESGLREGIDKLLAMKKVTEEGILHPPIPVIQQFIKEELPKQKEIGTSMPDDHIGDWSLLNQVYREYVVRWKADK